MLVKINSNLFVRASDVVSVKKITKTNSPHFGKWLAMVKDEHVIRGCEVSEGEVNFLIREINNFQEK